MNKSLKILIITAFLCILLNLFATLFLLWNFRNYVDGALDAYTLRSARKPLLLK